MPASTSVRDAHDALLADMPLGARHGADCPLCANPGAGAEKGKEVAHVADDPKFTESQHFALLADAVSRETAAITEAKTALETEKSALQETITGLESEKSALQSRIDVLEAEKVTEIASREKAEADFAAYQAELAELSAVSERKEARLTRVKASIDAPESYFTEARAARWAQMADEEFDELLVEFTELAAMKPHAFMKGDGGDCKMCGKSDSDGMHKMPEKAAEDAAARETAAFTGGAAPKPVEGGSTFGRFLTATGKLPAATS